MFLTQGIYELFLLMWDNVGWIFRCLVLAMQSCVTVNIGKVKRISEYENRRETDKAKV